MQHTPENPPEAQGTTSGPRLTIELVPSPCWFTNMRKVLSQQQWDVIRRRVYAEHNHRCAVCGDEGQMNCHEVWDYDDAHHIQRLAGFTSLCTMCHHVKHIGLAGILAQEGKLDYEAVVAHYMRVNSCTEAEFYRAHDAAFDVWRERSAHAWTTDLGEYGQFVAPADRIDYKPRTQPES
jgi:hypothetical protein